MIYLYYRMYFVCLKSDIFLELTPSIAAALTAILLEINVIELYSISIRFGTPPLSDTVNVNQMFYVSTFVLVSLSIFYFHGKRLRLIIEKYSIENKRQRTLGFWILGVWVALTLLILFIPAFISPFSHSVS